MPRRAPGKIPLALAVAERSRAILRRYAEYAHPAARSGGGSRAASRVVRQGAQHEPEPHWPPVAVFWLFLHREERCTRSRQRQEAGVAAREADFRAVLERVTEGLSGIIGRLRA